MPFTDTHLAAQMVQVEIQRAMSGEQPLLLAFKMSLFARELAGSEFAASILNGRKSKSPASCCD